jgi:hypothetical protein
MLLVSDLYLDGRTRLHSQLQVTGAQGDTQRVAYINNSSGRITHVVLRVRHCVYIYMLGKHPLNPCQKVYSSRCHPMENIPNKAIHKQGIVSCLLPITQLVRAPL